MERPILFSGPMVRAILEGRKTQTRRVVRPQPQVIDGCPSWKMGVNNKDGLRRRIPNGPRMCAGGRKVSMSDLILEYCPYGGPGDRLWVRETWMACDKRGFPVTEKPTRENTAEVIYRASHVGDGWRPSIFMPRWASRLALEITAVRVERLQDITEADAIAEGIAEYASEKTMEPGNPHREVFLHYAHKGQTNFHALVWYRKLWDGLNAHRGYSWDSNPWVWVLEFKQVEV